MTNFNYNKGEERFFDKTYNFIKGFAAGKGYQQTLKALPIARKFHNGQYRKGITIIDGEEVELPYICHPLKVCSTLISLNLPMTDEELDVLYATAILHDVIEDGKFKSSDTELMTEYGISSEVYHKVKLLSKVSGLNEEELQAYFENVSSDKITALVKLSDRSHNVEDLYNMKNIPKYIRETKKFIYPICSYGKLNFPELSNGFTVLKSKIVSLTEAQEATINIMNERIAELEEEIIKLKKEK